MPPITSNVKDKPKDTKGALKRILAYLGSYKLLIALILLLCLTSNVLALLGPNMAGEAINEATRGKGLVNFERVTHYALLMLIVYISSSLLTIAINILMTTVSRYVSRKMRNDVFDKLTRLPVGYFDRNATGDIISRVSYDIDVVTTCIATDLVAIMTSLVTVTGSFIMMVIIAPSLALVEILLIPASILYTIHMRKVTQPLFRRRSAAYGSMNGFVEEMFTGQKTILGYSYENDVADQFVVKNGEAGSGFYDSEYESCALGPTVNAFNNIGLGLVGMCGSILYMLGKISLGSVSSFVLYSRKFSGPINEIANIVSEIYSALSASERVFKLLDEPEEVQDIENADELTDVKGIVDFNAVKFGYVPERTIIHNLSLHVNGGNLIAIVGPTGAGKTTIINLLMRFYDVDGGFIAVDEKDIRKYTRKSLRGAYAMVLQDTWVFEGTIFENIAYGKENATIEEVIAAAKAAHIHSFVMQLPKGYDTVISEDGGNISKGQKQLLTIARAMLYDSKMLILDEATSNVDTGTERKVQEAMRNLMKDKTCFVIAHRLSTIQNADTILVLRDGDVVEAGNHESLMNSKGFYYSLYKAQFE
ncbi:MAG: ABC transporter ATP-binding protein/permease [Lachnospiraceae bacterium]|nr:ABC transporter ATP-binding protein/permease [Lachnospiraceae bacterium]